MSPEKEALLRKLLAAASPVNYRGNVDLFNRPEVENDGGLSTLFSTSYGLGDDGKETLLPRVRHGLDRIMTDDEAVQRYRDTGESLGTFASPTRATAEGDYLHKQQEALGGLLKPENMPSNYDALVSAIMSHRLAKK